VILLVHDVVLSLLLPTNGSAESVAIANELKIAKYIGSNVEVRQAVVIHTDNKASVTVAAWTSNDDLCILFLHFVLLLRCNAVVMVMILSGL